MSFNPSSVPGEAIPGSFVPGSSESGGSEWPSAYTYNFCPNPSCETDISGYVILHPDTTTPETLWQADSGFTGQASAAVKTPGAIPGEGITTPLGVVLADATGALSCWVFGNTGSLIVTAVTSSGSMLGAVPVTLNGTWQRVTVNSLALASGSSVQLLVQTTITQSITFQVDAVQYEPESPAHAYIDGDTPYASWVGTPELSPSYMLFPFPIGSVGPLTLAGSIDIVAQGEVFLIGNTNPLAGTVVLIEGQADISGQSHSMVPLTSFSRAASTATNPVGFPWILDTGVVGLPWQVAGGGWFTAVTVIYPLGGVNNFGVWETGVDPDPAQSLIGQNNAGTHSGQTSYNRIYGMFTPPIAQPDAKGDNIWQPAAFMAAGFSVASQTEYGSGTPNAVNFTDIQVEKVPYLPGTSPAPTAYVLPRSLATIVKPTQMNLVANPSMQVSTAGWTGYGGAAVGLDSVNSWNGEGQSIQMTAPNGSSGTYISVTDLIAGDIYTATAYVAAFSSQVQDIFMNVGALSAAATSNGSPLYGGDLAYPGYGDGPYGGVLAAAAPMPEGTWFLVPLSFTAPASTIQLSFKPLIVSGGSGSMIFDIGGVMVQPGELVLPYGDGNSDNWEWEAGGTPGLSRSYYYERQQVAAQAVTQVLGQHIPLGLTAFEPQFAVPYTQ